MKSIIVLLCGAELPGAKAADMSRSNTKRHQKVQTGASKKQSYCTAT